MRCALCQSSPNWHLSFKWGQLMMISFCREVRLLIPSGSEVSLGQVEIWRLWSDVRLTIPSGSEFRFGQSSIWRLWSDVRLTIPSRSEFKFGQSSICSIWRLWTKTKKIPNLQSLNTWIERQRVKERERENPKLITPATKATTGPPPDRTASRVTPTATAAAQSRHAPTPAALTLVLPFRFGFRFGMCFFFFLFLSHFILIYFNYLLLCYLLVV